MKIKKKSIYYKLKPTKKVTNLSLKAELKEGNGYITIQKDKSGPSSKQLHVYR